MINVAGRLLLAVVWLLAPLAVVYAADTPTAMYKPSSRSPAPIDILSNTYGASRSEVVHAAFRALKKGT